MRALAVISTIALLTLTGAVKAEPTTVTVRALAHDAKLIPGVQIEIRDAESDEVLDRGVTEGGTGDTDLLVREPIVRGAPIFDTEGAAAYTGELDVAEPMRVRVEALQPETGAFASKTLWVLPGRHVAGNGIVLELYGLDVDIHGPIGEGRTGATLPVTAEVRMLCGCPVTPGGLWDANGFSVTARLLRDDNVVVETPLQYAGETSLFSGELELPEPGDYQLRVIAAQPARSNFGTATTVMRVSDAR